MSAKKKPPGHAYNEALQRHRAEWTKRYPPEPVRERLYMIPDGRMVPFGEVPHSGAREIRIEVPEDPAHRRSRENRRAKLRARRRRARERSG